MSPRQGQLLPHLGSSLSRGDPQSSEGTVRVLHVPYHVDVLNSDIPFPVSSLGPEVDLRRETNFSSRPSGLCPWYRNLFRTSLRTPNVRCIGEWVLESHRRPTNKRYRGFVERVDRDESGGFPLLSPRPRGLPVRTVTLTPDVTLLGPVLSTPLYTLEGRVLSLLLERF